MPISTQSYSASTSATGPKLAATFNASGNWTVPTGVTQYYVDMIGAGGGNGGTLSVNISAGRYKNEFIGTYTPTGGRGGSASGWAATNAGTVIAIVVGAAGTAGTNASVGNANAATANGGNAGGISSVATNIFIANGGGGGGSSSASSSTLNGLISLSVGANGSAGNGSVPASTTVGLRPPAGAVSGYSQTVAGSGDGQPAATAGVVYIYTY